MGLVYDLILTTKTVVTITDKDVHYNARRDQNPWQPTLVDQFAHMKCHFVDFGPSSRYNTSPTVSSSSPERASYSLTK